LENFTNETLDISNLPKFESVPLTALHSAYWKVLLLSWMTVFIIVATGLGMAFLLIPKFSETGIKFATVAIILMAIILTFSRLAFRKKAYAFRNHDVLYRHGIISTTTIVIPYNRVQHVALHEGFVARMFGLAQVEIFTAGGSSSDIAIPGIAKEEAENIKQLLMAKIQKTL
jgi:membrane protein YdbS with pleckstrin-like domain